MVVDPWDDDAPPTLEPELPIGWQRLDKFTPPAEDAGTSFEDWAEAEHRQHPRKHLLAWFRGKRYVRIVAQYHRESNKEDKFSFYAVHYGELANPNKTDDGKYNGIKSIPDAVLKARVLMRVGGY